MALPFEKRGNKRVKTEKFKMEYHVLNDNHLVISEILNISEQGLCYLRSAPINRNDVIVMYFAFKSKRVEVKAKIIRIEGREVGVQFTDTEENIEEFINLFNKEYKLVKTETELKEEREKNLFAHRVEPINKNKL